MGQRETLPRSFGQKLRSELDRRNMGVRTLARTMAARDNSPARVESIRRQLKRYLSETDPVSPTDATRHSIEDALELERDSLEADEEDPASHVARRVPSRLESITFVREALEHNEPGGSLAEASPGSVNQGG